MGSDAESGKFTYVGAVGLDNARSEAKRLTKEAEKYLDEFEDNEFLIGLTEMLLKRDY